jgi:phage/conjugal plasmid C-4 type zinc finger TraR family protein
MADMADRAQAGEELYRREALAASASRVSIRVSNMWCEECGERIPEPRREAMPGCRLCVPCREAQEHER